MLNQRGRGLLFGRFLFSFSFCVLLLLLGFFVFLTLEFAEKMQILHKGQWQEERIEERYEVQDERRPFQYVSVSQASPVLDIAPATGPTSSAFANCTCVVAGVLRIVFQNQPLYVTQLLVQIGEALFRLLVGGVVGSFGVLALYLLFYCLKTNEKSIK